MSFMYEYMTEDELTLKKSEVMGENLAMHFDNQFKMAMMEHAVRLNDIETSCLINESTEDTLTELYEREMTIFTEGVKEIWDKICTAIRNLIAKITGNKPSTDVVAAAKNSNEKVKLPFNPNGLANTINKVVDAAKNMLNFKKQGTNGQTELDTEKIAKTVAGVAGVATVGAVAAAALKKHEGETEVQKSQLPGFLGEIQKAVAGAEAALKQHVEDSAVCQGINNLLTPVISRAQGFCQTIMSKLGMDAESKKEKEIQGNVKDHDKLVAQLKKLGVSFDEHDSTENLQKLLNDAKAKEPKADRNSIISKLKQYGVDFDEKASTKDLLALLNKTKQEKEASGRSSKEAQDAAARKNTNAAYNAQRSQENQENFIKKFESDQAMKGRFNTFKGFVKKYGLPNKEMGSTSDFSQNARTLMNAYTKKQKLNGQDVSEQDYNVAKTLVGFLGSNMKKNRADRLFDRAAEQVKNNTGRTLKKGEYDAQKGTYSAQVESVLDDIFEEFANPTIFGLTLSEVDSFINEFAEAIDEYEAQAMFEYASISDDDLQTESFLNPISDEDVDALCELAEEVL